MFVTKSSWLQQPMSLSLAIRTTELIIQHCCKLLACRDTACRVHQTSELRHVPGSTCLKPSELGGFESQRVRNTSCGAACKGIGSKTVLKPAVNHACMLACLHYFKVYPQLEGRVAPASNWNCLSADMHSSFITTQSYEMTTSTALSGNDLPCVRMLLPLPMPSTHLCTWKVVQL
jgi:hypothetical protein